MRVAILGNSGSGKSTLARQLAATHGLPVLHLDCVVWESDKVGVARAPDQQHADIDRFMTGNDQWIVEGCYGNLVGVALRHSPELWFLDLPEALCLENCRSRPWEPDKYQSKEAQDEKLPVLLEWVRGYYTREGDLSRRSHAALFENYSGRKRRFTERVAP
jgi:adenylate kinase family enzyme